MFTNNVQEAIVNWLHKKYFNKPGKVLEIGPGSGVALKALKQLGYEVYAVEANRKFISNFPKEMNVTVQDVGKTKLNFPNAYFDFIYLSHVIEHIKDQGLFWSELNRVLKLGGKIALMTPNFSVTHKTFYDEPTHVQPFTKVGLNSRLKLDGFRVDAIRNFNNIPYLWRYTDLALKIAVPYFPPFNKYYNILAIATKVTDTQVPY